MSWHSRIRYLLITVVIFCLFSFNAPAQSYRDSVALKDVIDHYTRKDHISFFYRYEWVRDTKIVWTPSRSLDDFIGQDLEKTGLGALIMNDSKNIILYRGQNPLMPEQINDVDVRMTSGAVSTVIENVMLSGYVEDAITGERIIGATIESDIGKKGTVSKHDGQFSLTLPVGVHHLKVTAVGKQFTQMQLELQSNMKINIEMYEKITQLEDVVISSGHMNQNISSGGMSQVKMDIKMLKTLPQFMGEIDVVRSLLLMPGVSSVGEGSSGFNVRGGNVDQNLILLDDAPLLNSSHLFGFFSAFNPDFVKDFVLFKGGMPANYGGRISSVLDVRTKDGSTNKVSISGGIGIISSRLMVDGYIGKPRKTTFAVGGRYAYPNWIIKKVPDLNVSQSSSYFYDANFKIRHQFNDNNNLSLSAYRSEDEFKFGADTTYGWNTTNMSLRWNNTLSNKLVASVTGIYSNYNNLVKGLVPTKDYQSRFGIDTKGAKVNFSWFPYVDHEVSFGASMMKYDFNNGSLIPGDESSITPIRLSDENSLEQGYFLADEWKANSKLLINAGIRYSRYGVYGGRLYLYAVGIRSERTITDTLMYDNNEKIKGYSGWEPRLSLKYSIDDKSSVKFSFNRNMQYMQLISNTAAVSPLDMWKSSNYYIKPQVGNQIAAGYFRNFFSDQIELSIEGYYKILKNVLDYKNGASLFLNQQIETQLLNGKGKAYGVELFIKRNAGKLTGWISYTYSRTLRKTAGITKEETINFGKYYPSNFDKPHDLSIAANYAWTRRLSVSANFTYSTGRPVTYPASVFVYDGYSFVQFTERNQARIPDYHRLDLSLTIHESLKKTKKWRGSWTFSVYNVYGRKNPYSVFFKPQYGGTQTQAYRLAVIGTIFPAITYNFNSNG